jgi:hypothetical protein
MRGFYEHYLWSEGFRLADAVSIEIQSSLKLDQAHLPGSIFNPCGVFTPSGASLALIGRFNMALSHQLWRIKEFSDVFLDALVRNEAGQLMFASLYGRDTAIQQLLAAFSLPLSSGGVDRITLVQVEAPPRPGSGVAGIVDLFPEMPPAEDHRGIAFIGDSSRLTKLAGKLPRRSLFGPVSHVFIYDPQVVDPDTANGRAWVLTFDTEEAVHRDAVWAMIQRISPVPLIETWRDSVLASLGDTIVADLNHQAKVTWPTMGPVRASQINLGESFPKAISELVKNRVLTRQVNISDATQQELPLAA